MAHHAVHVACGCFEYYMPQIIPMCQSLRPFEWFSVETCRNELNFEFLIRLARLQSTSHFIATKIILTETVAKKIHI